MALYEIVMGNRSGDTNYSRLILSNEPLDEENIDSVLHIDRSYGEYVLSVSIATVAINSWDKEEEKELINIRKQLL
jgi:hypothetical protein